ncbi:MAG: hypothetical protein JWO38_2482 [Gemmataceae bacterium]|nr:hypothetical protein [Gemmataceae bacterium]
MYKCNNCQTTFAVVPVNCPGCKLPILMTDEQYRISRAPAPVANACVRCGKSVPKGELSCPNCGNMPWGPIVAGIIIGWALIAIGIHLMLDAPDAQKRWFSGCACVAPGVVFLAVMLHGIVKCARGPKKM